MRFEERYRDNVIFENHALHRALEVHESDIKNLVPKKRNYPLRVLVIALGAIALTAYVLDQYNIPFSQLPGRIRQLAKCKLSLQMKVILAGAGLLVLGSFVIIYRVTRGKGKFWGDAHYKPVVLLRAPHERKHPDVGDEYVSQHLVDMSLIQNGSGTTNAVQRKGCEHALIAIAAAVSSPILAIGSIVYNVLRFAIIPFYIIGRLIQESYNGNAVYADQRRFHVTDIPKQMLLSVYWAVRAPFYATAYFFASLYALLDPMGGRKLGQLVSKEWMGNLERYESIWVVNPMGGYRFEGGGGPNRLGHHAFYITGCWLPWATVQVENGKITQAHYPGSSSKLFEYDIYEKEEAGYSIPDQMELPAKMDVTKEPMEMAKELPIGHYRCIKWNGQLYITAHVTRRSDHKTLYITKQIDEMPKNRDALLNQIVREKSGQIKESGQTCTNIIRAPNDSTDALPQDFYTMLKIEQQDDRLKNQAPLYSEATPSVTLALNLEVHAWSRIDVNSESYILAHTIDQWGDHLYIKKRLLKGEDTEHLGRNATISTYIRNALKKRNQRSYDFLGNETKASLTRRRSLEVIKRHIRPFAIDN